MKKPFRILLIILLVIVLTFLILKLLNFLTGGLGFVANEYWYDQCKQRGQIGKVFDYEYCTYLDITFYEPGTPSEIR